jgi:hypothetical protein
MATGAVLLGFLLFALLTWRQRKSLLYLVLLGAGTISAINEIPLSYAGHFYYPRPGALVGLDVYGRVVPVWAVFAYAIYVGGLSIAMCEWLRHGVTRTRVWAGVGVVCALNCLLEVTVLRTDNYVYYGEQPLRIDRFPAIWMAMNVIAVLGAATVVSTGWFTGRRMLLLLVAVPLAQVAGDWFGTPHFLALNSGASHWLKVSATVLSIGICAAVVDGLARFLAPEVARDDARPGGALHRDDDAAVGSAGAGPELLAGGAPRH